MWYLQWNKFSSLKYPCRFFITALLNIAMIALWQLQFLFVPGHQMVDPEVFRAFYTFWKETEAEAQDLNLPSGVISHLDSSECVYKFSSCVKTSYGVGKIALTQKRLFLLTEGQPGFLEITKFRDIQVKYILFTCLILNRCSLLLI